MRSTVLQNAIAAYKFGGRRRWADVFGRILAGFLDDNVQLFSEFDLIVSVPTWLGEGGRDFDHTHLVLEAAAAETFGTWPFDLGDPHAVVLTASTPRFSLSKTYQERKQLAFGQYRDALDVPNPSRTRALRILVYDDLFTNGLVLNEVARALIEKGGAASVCGVTLARAPWNR